MFSSSKKKTLRYRNSVMATKHEGDEKDIVLLEDNITYAGPLYKFNRSGQVGINPWRLRYFLVNTEDGSLRYYTSKNAYEGGETHKDRMHAIEVDVKGESLKKVTRTNRLRFDVAVKNDTRHAVESFVLRAKSRSQYELWSGILKRATHDKHTRVISVCKGCKQKEVLEVHPSMGHILLQYKCSHCDLVQNFEMSSESIEAIDVAKDNNPIVTSYLDRIGKIEEEEGGEGDNTLSSDNRKYTPRLPQNSPPTLPEENPDNNNNADTHLDDNENFYSRSRLGSIDRDDDSEITIPPLSDIDTYADNSLENDDIHGTNGEDNVDVNSTESVGNVVPGVVSVVSEPSSACMNKESNDLMDTRGSFWADEKAENKNDVEINEPNKIAPDELLQLGILDPDDDESKCSVGSLLSKEHLIQELSRMDHSQVLTAWSAAKLGLDSSTFSDTPRSPGDESKMHARNIETSTGVRHGSSHENEGISETFAALKILETSVNETNQHSMEVMLESNDRQTMSTPKVPRMKLLERIADANGHISGMSDDSEASSRICQTTSASNSSLSSMNKSPSSIQPPSTTQASIRSTLTLESDQVPMKNNKPFKHRTNKPSYQYPRQKTATDIKSRSPDEHMPSDLLAKHPKVSKTVFKIDKDKFESYGGMDDLESLQSTPVEMNGHELAKSSDFFFEERLAIDDMPRTTKEFQIYARLSRLSEVKLQEEVANNGLLGFKFRSPHEAKMAIVSMGQASRTSRNQFDGKSSIESTTSVDNTDLTASGSLRQVSQRSSNENKDKSDLLMRGQAISASAPGSLKKRSLFNSRGNVSTDKDPFYFHHKVPDPPTGVKEFQAYCKLLKTSNMNLNKELVACELEKYQFRSTHESVMAILAEKSRIEAERRREARKTTRMGATFYQKERPETSPLRSDKKEANYFQKLTSPLPFSSPSKSARAMEPHKPYFFVNKLTESAPLNAKQSVQYGKFSSMSSMALDIEVEKMNLNQFAYRNNHEKIMGIISVRFNTLLDQRCFGVNVPTFQSSSTKDINIDDIHMKIQIPTNGSSSVDTQNSTDSPAKISEQRCLLETMNTTELATRLRLCNLSPEKYSYNKAKMINVLLGTDENKIASLFQKKVKKKQRNFHPKTEKKCVFGR